MVFVAALLSSSANHLTIQGIPMGKGDRKTRRGKINRSSYGNTRAHTVAPVVAGSKPTVTKPAATKKAAPRKKSA
jgi:30S ribosomal protein S31